jgi:hypothetical protein
MKDTSNEFNEIAIEQNNYDDFPEYHHVYAIMSTPIIATDDVVITGVQVSDNSESSSTVLFGQSGYVVDISKNGLIQSQSDAQKVADFVGKKLVGTRFRPMSLSVRSDPSIEAGDVAYVTTRKGSYQILVSNVSYGIGQFTRISCDAESPARNSATRYTESTKTYVKARETTEAKLTAYDLMVQQLNNLVSHSFGVYKTAQEQPDGSVIYYMHDKPTLAESMKIWKQTADAFAVSTDGGVTYTAGFDVEGNAVVNVLSAIGINADWIRTGKLLSNDGATLIDMAYGVANTDNLAFADNIQSGYPLIMPFRIDGSVSKIQSVLLNYTQQNFRTSSTTASSGGGSSITSENGGGTTTTASEFTGNFFTNHATQDVSAGNTELVTSSAIGTTLHNHVINGHSHVITSYSHNHNVTAVHTHNIYLPSHTHSVSLPSHTHALNFGIQESSITDNTIQIYVDGTLRATVTDLQGVVDLTAWVTTTGWHKIEIRSAVLKRVSTQIFIKSYVHM